jgi:hypothetical protein
MTKQKQQPQPRNLNVKIEDATLKEAKKKAIDLNVTLKEYTEQALKELNYKGIYYGKK